MRALNDPSNLPKPAAVWLSASGNAGGNASLVQDAPVLVVIVASIRMTRLGRLSGRPRTPLIGAIASIRGISCVTSLRLAPVKIATIGVPLASVARWCLEPGRARSVGFGPVFRPPQPLESTRSRRPHVRSRSGLPRVVWSAATRAMHPTRQPLASPAAVASNSRPSHIPFPQEDRASECRSSARTECPSALRDSARACGPGT